MMGIFIHMDISKSVTRRTRREKMIFATTEL